jgi:omega-amidase
MTTTPLRVGLCQILVGLDKALNIETAKLAVREASTKGANLVSLPECFNSPYAVDQFAQYSEQVPNVGEDANARDHPTTSALVQLAKELKIHLVGGSIPEKDKLTGKLFNTCIVAGPTGDIIAKHRKVHLFDVDIPDMKFTESTTLSAGDALTTFSTPWGLVGVGICYDMRFPALASLMRQQGARILIYPGAFNTKTGPAHWELLQRARAVDNQVFVATCSPARNPQSKYQAWGHSSLISPWGEVLMTTNEHASVLVSSELDLAQVDRVRAQIPVSLQARTDLYSLEKWRADEEGKRRKLS